MKIFVMIPSGSVTHCLIFATWIITIKPIRFLKAACITNADQVKRLVISFLVL